MDFFFFLSPPSSPSPSSSSPSCSSSMSSSIPWSSLFLNPSIVPFVFSYVSFNGNSMGSTMVTTSVTCGSDALSGTFSKSKARVSVDMISKDQTNICLPQFIPDLSTYPANTPAIPLGLNLDGASAFLASLGLKYTLAPKGIIFPPNFSLCIFSHALPSSNRSMFNA